jgi:O-antigen/teichoic acid export membrane protein
MNLFNMKRSSGLVQSALVAVGNVGASGFSAISLIILSRFLGPAQFGSFSVAFSLTQLVARIGDLGFATALQRFVAKTYQSHPDQAAAAAQIVAVIKAGVMLLVILLGLGVGPTIASTFFHVSDNRIVTLGICLANIVMVYEYMVTMLQAIAKFAQSVLVNAIQAGTKCVLAIASYFIATPNSFVAYLWYGAAPLLAVGIGSHTIVKYFKKSKTTWSSVWPELRRVAQFSFIGVIAAAVGDNVDVLMVNASLTEAQTGLYAAAARIALMLTLFGLSFGTVFNTRIAQYQNKVDLNKFFTKALFFAVASLLCIPLGLLVAKPLLVLTAGQEFVGATMAMNYLMASAFVMMAAIPFIAVFYVVDFPAYFAVAGMIQTVTLIAGNFVLIPLFGIEGAGMAKLVARTLVAIYTVSAAYRHAKKQYQIEWPTLKMARSVIYE